MCEAVIYTHPYCKCRWMAITRPCAPGYGFNNCPTFFNGRTNPPMDSVQATHEPCPVHELFGQYDRNLARTVIKIEYGVEVRCCTVM